jgi:hypothetical protein
MKGQPLYKDANPSVIVNRLKIPLNFEADRELQSLREKVH